MQVSTLLVAQTFLTSFYSWDVDAREVPPSLDRTSSADGRAGAGDGGDCASANCSLLVPQTELLTLFQTRRHTVIHWLDAHVELADEVFEAIERVLSYTGVRRRAAADPPTRQWMRLGSHGRFMPMTDCTAAEASRKRTQMEAKRDGYERWYWRVCNESAA